MKMFVKGLSILSALVPYCGPMVNGALHSIEKEDRT